MTKSFGMTRDYDFSLDGSRNLAVVTGRHAVAVASVCAMSARLGEMPLAMNRGVPYADTVFDNYEPRLFELAARRVLQAVPGVLAVKNLQIKQRRDFFDYSVELVTDEGGLQLGNI